MRIMFMGTPDIARDSLARLLDDGHNVVSVVTGEDKPRGRGHIMTPTPTKELALSYGVKVYTPKTLRDEEFMATLRECDPELIVVVAYGKILPRDVLDYPKYGCINLHVSLLPEYRGAAPIQRAIMAGESNTGVTIMYMEEGLDTGDIIKQEVFPIEMHENAEVIHDRASLIGSALLSKTIIDIENGNVTRVKQEDSISSYAPKIEKEDCRIIFDRDSFECQSRIRGVTPFPGAFCYHNGKELKIVECMPVVAYQHDYKPGTVTEMSDRGDGYFDVVCNPGTLRITKVKPQGKGVMTAGDYIRGRKINLYECLESYE